MPKPSRQDPALEQDAKRYRALAAETRLDVDEEGGLRLVSALAQPIAESSTACRQLLTLLGGDRRAITRAVDRRLAAAG